MDCDSIFGLPQSTDPEGNLGQTRAMNFTDGYSVNPEIAVELAEAADTLFTTEKLIDASAIVNALLDNKDRIGLVNTLAAASSRLLALHLLARTELDAEAEICALASRVVTDMWERPQNELLGAGQLRAWHVNGNPHALDVDTRRVLASADPGDTLLVLALNATGLSAIVSHEMGLPRHGDAIREVLS